MFQDCLSKRRLIVAAVICFTVSVGCRVSSPIHVWQPAGLQSTAGSKVLLARLNGPNQAAESIQQRMLQLAPKDHGRSVDLVTKADLSSTGSGNSIRLVSYEDDDSDLVTLMRAKASGVDYILQGEILKDRRPESIKQSDKRLSVSWRLMPTDPQSAAEQPVGPQGMPVTVDLPTALRLHPDLAVAADQDVALEAALVRQTFPLITPSVQRASVQLEIAYLFPGSKLIRKGNALALLGRWADAEQAWKTSLEKNPFSSIAIHNLAIAAVAKQDYSRARELARQAVRMKPSRLHQQTSVWVEQMQRSYHQAFHLPDPPEGWMLTRSPR